jgi:hypothetical protein
MESLQQFKTANLNYRNAVFILMVAAMILVQAAKK